MAITVRDLIEMLEEMNPEAEVKMAYQPNWPLEVAIDGEIKEVNGTVYIRQDAWASGDYAPGAVFGEDEEEMEE